MSIFDENTRKIIEYAIVFEGLDKGKDTASMLYQEAVRNKALIDVKNDALEFFYGFGVYDKISTAKKAVESVCIATELKNFYNNMQGVGSMNDEKNCWAKYSEQKDEVYKKFFLWIQERDKTPKIEDLSLIKSVAARLKCGFGANYKVTSDSIRHSSFFDIVRQICDGRISVDSNGDLR